jgi:hypothetical protein
MLRPSDLLSLQGESNPAAPSIHHSLSFFWGATAPLVREAGSYVPGCSNSQTWKLITCCYGLHLSALLRSCVECLVASHGVLGDATFRRWGLVEGSKDTGSVPLKKILGSLSLFLFLFLLPGHNELSSFI